MAANLTPQYLQAESTYRAARTPDDKLAALFGTGRKRLDENHPVEIVNTGLRSLHIPLTGLAS